MNTNINVIDLFAGAGGFSLGIHKASNRFKTIRAVEIDDDAAATFGANFGKDSIYKGDIAEWLLEEAEKFADRVDLVIGGPPCQGFSNLGKRDVNDERNKLWRSYAKTIKKVKPKIFIMENVSNFYNSIEFDLFKNEFLEDGALKEYSYREYKINSADYGSAQNRIRAVIIGYRKEIPSSNVAIISPKRNKSNYKTVREAFMNIPETPDSKWVISKSKNPERIPGPFMLKDTHWARKYQEKSLMRFSKIPPGGNRFDLPEDLMAPCWVKHKSGSGDVMGRLRWDQPSVTIRTEFFKPEKGRYLHPSLNRAITHFEAGRLQGFPDDYKFYGSKTSIARQIGNAVPVELGQALGESVLKIIEEQYNGR